MLSDDPPQILGVRDRERMIGGATPMHDQGIYQILYALSTLTGQPRCPARARSM